MNFNVDKPMSDELIDIFDENMNFLGTAMKSQAHREGLWHKTFHCWLAQKDVNGKILLWLQLRNFDKDIFPGKLDISAAGHIRAGEEVKDAYREISEELGLKLNKDDIIKLFTSKEIYEAESVNNREFQMVYMAMVEGSPYKAVLQPEEVAGLYEVDIDEFCNLINERTDQIEAKGIKRNPDSSYTLEFRNVTKADVAPHAKEYYNKALEMIKRFVTNSSLAS
ncbi:MAG: NUDIX domain-containing protein [Alphaproteobacteria bacterium]|nr:NUDIX domain-containing protein [Alphaproteobacteria bacterium]